MRSLHDLMFAPELKIDSPQTVFRVRERHNLTFHVTFPLDTVLPLKLEVAVPVHNKRAIFHITDIHFGSTLNLNSSMKNAQGTLGYGSNILGVAEHLNIHKVYDVEYIKTDRITTHMQRDSLVVDFGFMTSAGQAFSQ